MPVLKILSVLVLLLSVAPLDCQTSKVCSESVITDSVCSEANDIALQQMRHWHLTATILVQNVATGAVLVFASSDPASLDVASQVLPLSLSKLFLAASWWDRNQPDSTFRSRGTPNAPNPAYREFVNVHDLLVGGSDSAGEQMAIALRHNVGEHAVLDDLYRYGFNRSDQPHWAYVEPQWTSRFRAQPSSASLAHLTDEQWGAALSIGETYMQTTPLQVSQFLQAVGNNGVQCAPNARSLAAAKPSATKGQFCLEQRRIVDERTAALLIIAMNDLVKRGSASGIASALQGTGWSMGGRTGTGGRVGVPLEEMDGWFAGLISDAHGKTRFTVATFVKKGGRGAGKAAELSAQIARILVSAADRSETDCDVCSMCF